MTAIVPGCRKASIGYGLAGVGVAAVFDRVCHCFIGRQQDVVQKILFDGDGCQPFMHRLPCRRELSWYGRQHADEAARPDVAGTQREHHDVVAVTVGWVHPFQKLVADGLDGQVGTVRGDGLQTGESIGQRLAGPLDQSVGIEQDQTARGQVRPCAGVG